MKPIVLFDAECRFCATNVRLLLRMDKEGALQLASLHSEVGRKLLLEHGLPGDYLDSVVLIEEGRARLGSDAALGILRHLRQPWRIFHGLRHIPRCIREPIYRFIARNRYRILGRETRCLLPTPELKARFLDL